MAWSSVLSDTAQSLEDRVTTFYLRHIEDEDGIGLRLFLRAALDGWSLPLRMTDLLIDKLVRPLIGEMRRNAKLPDYAATPLMVGEFELVMSLHASVIFYSIRAHIYGTEMPADAPSVVRLYVNAFLSGAASSMAALHGPGAPADLKLPAGAVKAKV